MSDKAKFFRKFIERIFCNVAMFKHLSTDGFFKGFYFMFVYKDFVVRDLIRRVRESLPQVQQK